MIIGLFFPLYMYGLELSLCFDQCLNYLPVSASLRILNDVYNSKLRRTSLTL